MTTTTGKQSLPASHGRNRVRRQPKDVAFDVVLYLICAILLILILYPLWFIVIASFSDPSAVAGGPVWFVPVGFTLDGYEELLNQPNVWVGYRNTILYTVTGTLFGLAVNIPAAYALSRKDLWGRKALMGLFVFTMFFSGGLIHQSHPDNSWLIGHRAEHADTGTGHGCSQWQAGSGSA